MAGTVGRRPRHPGAGASLLIETLAKGELSFSRIPLVSAGSIAIVLVLDHGNEKLSHATRSGIFRPRLAASA